MKTHEIILLQGAQSDLLSIYSLLGEKVYNRVDKALGILRVFPSAGPVHLGDNFRRLVVSKTALGIFYTLTGHRVIVAAILDLRQSPDSIQIRLRPL